VINPCPECPDGSTHEEQRCASKEPRMHNIFEQRREWAYALTYKSGYCTPCVVKIKMNPTYNPKTQFCMNCQNVYQKRLTDASSKEAIIEQL
jgi:hypothetical protein